MKKAIVFLMLLSSSLLQAQDYFNNHMLDLMDKAGRKVKINSIKKELIDRDFKLTDVEDNKTGGKSYSFESGNYFIGIVYYKDDRIISIIGGSSPMEFYQCEEALKTKGFKIIETKKEKNKNDVIVEIVKWSKDGYPYHIVTSHINYSISFESSISKDY
jgi:hypothetical protein